MLWKDFSLVGTELTGEMKGAKYKKKHWNKKLLDSLGSPSNRATVQNTVRATVV